MVSDFLEVVQDEKCSDMVDCPGHCKTFKFSDAIDFILVLEQSGRVSTCVFLKVVVDLSQ